MESATENSLRSRQKIQRKLKWKTWISFDSSRSTRSLSQRTIRLLNFLSRSYIPSKPFR